MDKNGERELRISDQVQELFLNANFQICGMLLRHVDCLSVRGKGRMCLKRGEIEAQGENVVVVRKSKGCEGCEWNG